MNINPAMIWLLKSPLHGLLSSSFMLVQFTGSQSGKAYTVPVNYVIDDDHLVVLSMRSRRWWRNLRTSAPVLRVKGAEIPARAEVIEAPAQTAAALMKVWQATPGYRRFLDIGEDEQGQPKAEDALQAASTRVVIKFFVEQPPASG